MVLSPSLSILYKHKYVYVCLLHFQKEVADEESQCKKKDSKKKEEKYVLFKTYTIAVLSL